MTYSAAALAGLGAQWVSIEPDHLVSALSGRTTADHELIDWLEETSRKLTGLPTEQRQHTIKMMDAHLETVTDLIEGGRHTGTSTKRLHSLAASLSTTCGWYRFDQGGTTRRESCGRQPCTPPTPQATATLEPVSYLISPISPTGSGNRTSPWTSSATRSPALNTRPPGRCCSSAGPGPTPRSVNAPSATAISPKPRRHCCCSPSMPHRTGAHG
ncbi:hypothetical protein NKH18_47900 [Streptomyces sp. M10(2022)]